MYSVMYTSHDFYHVIFISEGICIGSVAHAGILQASAAAYLSPHNMHQSMAEWSMSGGPPSERQCYEGAHQCAF